MNNNRNKSREACNEKNISCDVIAFKHDSIC